MLAEHHLPLLLDSLTGLPAFFLLMALGLLSLLLPLGLLVSCWTGRHRALRKIYAAYGICGVAVGYGLYLSLNNGYPTEVVRWLAGHAALGLLAALTHGSLISGRKT